MDLEALEIDLFLEAIYRYHGHEFRDYVRASMRRRILSRVSAERVETITELLSKVLHEPACMARLLSVLTVHTTSMFRDAGFHRAFRNKIIPPLKTYPFARIWHAGCSTGEEVYSMAILLHEEGLHARSRIYATDVGEAALKAARAGVYPLTAMQEYTQNYVQSGGTRSFSEWYTADQDHAILRPSLRDNIVFAGHNLATDASFNEFNVVLCRNVMIYFNKVLQDRVHKLLYESLGRFGILVIGRQESLRFTPYEACYEELDGREKIYRKVR